MNRWLCISLIGLFLSCNAKRNAKNDVLVAEFKKGKLYMSELSVPYFSNKKDSIKYINAKAEEWMRTEVLLAEAEKEIQSDPQLENLVAEYRKNLLLAKFEKSYVENNLDSQVTDAQVQQFISTHELPVNSKGPQIKCSFGKIKSNKDNLEKLDEWWKEENIDEIRSYCATFAEISLLENEQWIALSELKKYIPSDVFKKENYSKKGYYQKSYKGYEYFLFVNDYQKESKELNTADGEKIKKLILHQRQLKLLKKYKEELYSNTINEKQIKFYFN